MAVHQVTVKERRSFEVSETFELVAGDDTIEIKLPQKVPTGKKVRGSIVINCVLEPTT